MQITIEVPDLLGEKLQHVSDRFPELLERGLQELQNEQAGNAQDEQEIMALLVSQPSPDLSYPSLTYTASASERFVGSKQNKRSVATRNSRT